MAEDGEKKKESSGGGSPMKLIMVMIVGGVLLVAVSIGGVFFMMKSMGMLDGKGGGGDSQKQEQVATADKPPIYFPLEPAFVANFKDRGRTRFLQVTLDVMATDQKIIDELQTHMPLIRNNILILLSKQDGEVLQSGEGKEKVRQAILKELQTIMTDKTNMVKTVEDVYITSFVTQ